MANTPYYTKAESDSKFDNVTAENIETALGRVPVGGSGTAEIIPKFTSGTAIGDSKLMNLRLWADYLTNLFLGSGAGINNTYLSSTEGAQNTFIGVNAGNKNTTGYAILNIGFGAGMNNETGARNTNVGYQAGHSNVAGNNNTNLGVDAGARNKGNDNIYIGYHAATGFDEFSTGDNNNLIGSETGLSLTTAFGNNGFGRRVFYYLTTGYNNAAFGDLAGFNLTTGISNVLLGRDAGFNLTSESENTVVGQRAGYRLTGSFNVLVGSLSGSELTTASNCIVIGRAGIGALQKKDAVGVIIIGNGAYATKDFQAVIGSSGITETLLRGKVLIGTENNNGVDTLQVEGSGKFTGAVTTGSGATRPTAGLSAGSQFFDTALGKPIWYNGSAWVDAMGTVV